MTAMTDAITPLEPTPFQKIIRGRRSIRRFLDAGGAGEAQGLPRSGPDRALGPQRPALALRRRRRARAQGPAGRGRPSPASTGIEVRRAGPGPPRPAGPARLRRPPSRRAGSRGCPTIFIDMGIAGEHIVLQAEELGLATCWMGWFRLPPGPQGPEDPPDVQGRGHDADRLRREEADARAAPEDARGDRRVQQGPPGLRDRRMLVFVAIALSVYGLVNLYIVRRGAQALSSAPAARTVFLVLFIGLAVVFPLGPHSHESFERPADLDPGRDRDLPFGGHALRLHGRPRRRLRPPDQRVRPVPAEKPVRRGSEDRARGRSRPSPASWS